MITPKIIDRESFHIMGIISHFQSGEVNFDHLWQEYMKIDEELKEYSTGDGNYGLYLGPTYREPLHYLAGSGVKNIDSIPLGIEVRKVPAAKYAVFKTSYDDLLEIYNYIWDEWLSTSIYVKDPKKPWFDYYPIDNSEDETNIEIWIPIIKK